MLLDKIRKDETLSKIIIERCEEEGICVEVDAKLNREDYVILKPDGYYNSLNIEKRPKSPDCLFVVRCGQNGFAVTIAELRVKEFTVEEIREKFTTCLFDFMQYKFGTLFNREYKRIDLFFVSHNELYRRDMGLKMKFLMDIRFKFNEQKVWITPHMPSPAVKPCY